LRNFLTKISLFILIGILIVACVSEKRVPEGKKFLVKNEVLVNNKKVTTDDATNQIYQKPNSSILGYPLKLNLYNMANLKHDSLYKAKFINDPEKYKRMSKFYSAKQVNRLGESFWYAGFSDYLARVGEPPVIIDDKSALKSTVRLKSYYFNNGFFNVTSSYKIDSIGNKKGKVKYIVNTGEAFLIDTLETAIQTPALDTLYQKNKVDSKIKVNNPYNKDQIDEERSRLTTLFRNNGAYLFQQNYISFDIDTINKKNKADLNLKIGDYSYRVGDSTYTEPFKIYKISDVNIYTDYDQNITKLKNIDTTKTVYNGFNIYSNGKLKYKPKAITNGSFINKGNLYTDINSTLTSRYFNNLKVFNYPTIQYNPDPKDSTGNSLVANIYLKPKKKYGLETSLDVTHSNIQDIGLSGTAALSIRNVFNGAETFQIAASGTIGSSRDQSKDNSQFFDTNEYAIDFRLNFPRILMFFNTDNIIPKKMIPSTTISAGLGAQNNIGLDKETLNTALSYNWTIRKNTTAKFDLVNIQFIKNVNTSNYFYVYESSYDDLNTISKPYNTADPSFYDANGNLIIESGTNGFLDAVLGPDPTIFLPQTEYEQVNSINEQKNRLTENNLIFATNFSYNKSTKIDDLDERYFSFRTKLETAGNFLSLITTNQPVNQNGYKEIFGLEYSQYAKIDLEYIKHWDLNHKKVIAFRSFVGFALPYGNANYIPFSRSYYAGGSNDNRGWLAYSLGPGSSNSINNYNEANFKIALNLEYRFNILGNFNGALFVDSGNIWNVFDNVTYQPAVFESLSSLQEMAMATGFGLRYDFGFFVFRFDFGFKAYNPADNGNPKWFYDFGFKSSVVNIGINYPF
jgi:outer membrane protein assembly factor BamA